MDNIIDFTNCKVDLSHTYLGANGQKIAVNYNNEVYMLKFPALTCENPKAYSNSIFSEYISCHIFNLLGFNTQETILGTYTKNNITRYVCACKDFTDNNHILQEFASIKNTIIDSPMNGYGTDLSEVLNTINEQQSIDSTKLKNFFWDMFIVDSLLGNFDRHNGNWGFLYNKISNKADIAPIYDCGSCLFPKADDKVLEIELNDENELDKRVFIFPNSALKIDDKKINPYQFIFTHENYDCDEALKRIFPKIDLTKINEIIDNTPIISNIRKRYYKTIIKKRYEEILVPAYKHLILFNKI